MTTPTRIPPNNLAMDQVRTTSPMDSLLSRVTEDSDTRLGVRTIDLIAATGMDADQAADTAPNQYAVGQVVSESTNGLVDPEQMIEDGASQGRDPNEVLSEVYNIQTRAAGTQTYGDFILEGHLAVGNPEYAQAELNILNNQQILREVLLDTFTNPEERTNAGLVIDFLDRYIVSYFPFTFYDDLTMRGERNGAMILQNAATMSAEEFRAFAEEWAEERRTEGIFNDNFFALEQALHEAENNGYSPRATTDQNFAAFDLLTLGLPVGRGIVRAGRRIAGMTDRALTVGTGPIARASGVAGVAAADEVAEALVRGGAHAVPDVADDLVDGTVSLGRTPGSVTHRVPTAAQILQHNPIIQRVMALYRSGVFGVTASPDEIRAAATASVGRLRSNFDNPVMDTRTFDATGLGDHTLEVVVGRPVIGVADGGGLPFRTADAAQSFVDDMVDRGVAAEVRAVDPDDPSMGFNVVLSERLDLSTVAQPFEVGQVSAGLLARALGRGTDNAGFSDLAMLGEAGVNQISRELQPFLNRIRILDADGRYTLDRVFVQARDGADSIMNRNYTREEFNTVWRENHPNSLRATDADWNAYQAAVTVNDAAYIMQANRIAQRYVVRGYHAVEFNGFRTPARPIQRTMTSEDTVFDAASGRNIPGDRVPEGTGVWELERAAGDVRYVTNPDVRPIQYDDVLGYNSAGRRTNPDANFFVTSGDRAIMTSYTEAAGRVAVRSLQEIQTVFRATGRALGDLTDELDGVLAANRSWHHGIENTEDFVNWIRREGLEETFSEGEISIKARDGVIEGQEDLWNGATFGDRVSAQQSRRPHPLTEVGGGTGRQFSPVATMVSQMNDAGMAFAFRASTQRAKASWLRRLNGGKELPRGTDVNAAFRAAGVPSERTARGRALRALRAQIERRENVVSPAARAFNDFGDTIAAFVFDRFGKKGWGLPDANTLQNTLLGFGFQSAFGFFNISQFALQASHIGIIGAISPRHGLAAGMNVLPIRLAMNAPEAARELALRNLSRVNGMSVDEMNDYWTYLRTSGRDLIDGDQMEKGTGPGFGISGFNGADYRPGFIRRQWTRTERVRGAVGRASVAPFNEGERLSRHTAILTAFREFRAAHPNVSPLSPQGRAWISAREQKLTFHMTTASRGAWQTGAMRIPTQWLGYSMRSFENIVVGRDFTKAERIRMAVWVALSSGMMGTAGAVGMYSAADYVSEWLGLEPGGNADVALRYGVIDGVMSWGLSEVTDQDIRTAFGSRIAPLNAFQDLYRRVTEESAFTALGGPSTEMAGGFAQALISTAGAVFNGTTAIAMQDIERVLRTPGGLNNLFTAEGIINYGIYRGRTGTTLPMEFSDVEGLLQAAGLTNFRVAEYYARRTEAFRDSRQLRDYQRNIQNRWREAIAMMDTDREAGLQLMNDIGVMIAISGFSPYDQMQIRRALTADTSNDLVVMATRALQNENRYGAEVIESLR